MLTGLYDKVYGGVCDEAKPWRSVGASEGRYPAEAWHSGGAYASWWRDYDAHCNAKPRHHFDEFPHAFLTIFQVPGQGYGQG